jgi:ribonuclease P protein subunit RPR2
VQELPSSGFVKDLARQRIEGLFQLALENAREHPELSDRYVEMAIRLSKRTRVRLPRSWKRLVCSSCGSFLYPGIGSRVRLAQRRSTHVVVTCLRCGGIKRYAIIDKQTKTSP